MPENNTRLGICFFGNQLFYAVSSADQPNRLSRIGAVDFSFDVAESLIKNQQSHITGLRDCINDLAERFHISRFNLLVHPTMECWATLPKLVYDDAEEREAYINILMSGTDRKDIYPAWHSLSKDNFKLLQLRSEHALAGSHALTDGLANVEFSSAFEIGERWIAHARPGGSFLTISTFQNCISASSFILGKLRGATYIEYDDADDLPYLWLQQAQELPWLQGLHEQIQVYGHDAYRIIDILAPFWDEAGTVTKMDTLDKMQVQAAEDTYGFELERAYPAIMLALGN